MSNLEKIDTRILQYRLRNCQVKLGICTDPRMAEAYRLRIRELANELLYRWRKGTQTLTA